MSISNVRKSDVDSVGAIVQASYEVISGRAGEKRDWERFRSLYAPGARLMPVIGGAEPHVRVLSPEEYIERVEAIFTKESFWERETSREEKIIGRVAHVLSHYESLHDPAGEAFEHGTNSIQLFHDGQRWWIVSVMWNTARSG